MRAAASLDKPSYEEYWSDIEGLAQREKVTDEAFWVLDILPNEISNKNLFGRRKQNADQSDSMDIVLN